MLGLKRGEVMLCEHQKEWDEIAKQTIAKLKAIFGDTAVDIQHIGSTAIPHIKAKPMIDIAVGVKSFDDLDGFFTDLEKIGIYKSPAQPLPGIILCALKTEKDSDICLCVPHFVIYNSPEWVNHINFRNYMNAFPKKAKEYEVLKAALAVKFPNDRNTYSDGKRDFINNILRKALVNSYFGKTVTVKID